MSILDRYSSLRATSKKCYQLAAMSSLHLSIKLYTPRPLRLQDLVSLSRGYFTKDHVLVMESGEKTCSSPLPTLAPRF